MQALHASGAWRRLIGLFVCLAMAVLALPVQAGGPDSHLTATDFIARLLGFTEEEARLIAAADQSIDASERSAPVPADLKKLKSREERIKQQLRDRLVHSLNESPEASMKELDRLRVAVEGQWR